MITAKELANRALTRGWILCFYGALALTSCAKSRHAIDADAAVVLPDNTAGKACRRDADCAGGRCADALHIVLATQGSDAPDGYCTTACDSDFQCGATGECSVPAGEERGECLSRCAEDAQCRAGYSCVGAAAGAIGGLRLSGTCQPKPETDQLDDGIVGQACASNADCTGGECAKSSPLGVKLPGNYCTARCLEDAECGAGGGCLVFAGSSNAGFCYARCDSDTDCERAGYRCVTLGPGLDGCYPAPSPLPDFSAGEACDSELDCGGTGSCASELPFGSLAANEIVAAPGGYCTQPCSRDAECGAEGQCISRGVQGGLCLGKCHGDGDCRTGYSCVVHDRDHIANDRVCIPQL